MNCPHRSETFRLVDCPSCSGMVKVKVYECSRHLECSVSKQLPGIHVCDCKAPPVPQTVFRQQSQPSQTVRAISATLLHRIDTDVRQTSVILDDGRTVSAVNESRNKKSINMRCVVVERDGGFVVVQ